MQIIQTQHPPLAAVTRNFLACLSRPGKMPHVSKRTEVEFRIPLQKNLCISTTTGEVSSISCPQEEIQVTTEMELCFPLNNDTIIDPAAYIYNKRYQQCTHSNLDFRTAAGSTEYHNSFPSAHRTCCKGRIIKIGSSQTTLAKKN